MIDTTVELVRALQLAVTEKLRASGVLQEGNTISIRAVVLGKNNLPRKTLTIDEGLDIFRRGGSAFYNRELTNAETLLLKGISWSDGWQRNFILHVLENNNQPVGHEAVRELAKSKGYIKHRSPNIIWPTVVLSLVNKQIKEASQPFRIIKIPSKSNVSFSETFYRLYRMIDMAKEIPENTTV
jgi:hypothetical protein